MDQRDIDTIIRLSKEGKQTAKIWAEDYPELDYWDVYQVINEAGEQSALGVKRTISNRLSELREMAQNKNNYDDEDFNKVIDGIDELVTFLYERHKANQKKLDSIRETINS